MVFIYGVKLINHLEIPRQPISPHSMAGETPDHRISINPLANMTKLDFTVYTSAQPLLLENRYVSKIDTRRAVYFFRNLCQCRNTTNSHCLTRWVVVLNTLYCLPQHPNTLAGEKTRYRLDKPKIRNTTLAGNFRAWMEQCRHWRCCKVSEYCFLSLSDIGLIKARLHHQPPHPE